MAQEAAEEEPLNLNSLLEEMVSRNRHVSGMALVSQEGGEGDAAEVVPIAVGLEPPGPEATAALNSAFFEGEDSKSICQLGGRHLQPTKRLEIGDFLIVKLAEAVAGKSSSDGKGDSRAAGPDDDFKSFTSGSAGGLHAMARAAEEASQALSGAAGAIAESAGAWICCTRRWVLVVAFDAGMDESFALKVCHGLSEHLVEEGH
eukprot:TRINITY_DN702_c0_g1_i1.p1 TRINITY_DN702_c0_g1~~TRINITY_DN702_c0_g1_i1.p1  ORF type:complete len:203 (+),score=44.61 TRINITY_DN702_c0_g1_i1:95-703(+)